MKQHVQLPNDMTENLVPQDLLIYLAIKRHMNNETKEAFPSLNKICEESGASINTVRKCIDRLVDNGYIEVIKKGRSNVYKFLKWDKFEAFSYEFLDNKDLSFTEKAYLAAAQQYMFKDNEPYGIIKYSNQELSKLINMPEKTIYKCDKSLKDKDCLSIVKTDQINQETGLPIKEKFYNLTKVEQEIVFILKTHEDRLNDIDSELERSRKLQETLLKRIEQQDELIKKLTEKHNYVI
jgi:DNA-binding GntR family transcriptional regulator